MHYSNRHNFVLPFVPTQRRDSEGRPIEQWYIPIPGLHGHYLYSNGDISHSFNYELTNDGYDWMYPTLSSALDAMILYRAKAANETVQPDIIIDAYYPDHNQAVSYGIPTGAIPNPPLTPAVPPLLQSVEPAPHPSWEVTEYVDFLEPRPHTIIRHKWVVANFIPEAKETDRHIYLRDNGKTIARVVVSGDNGSTGLFNSEDEAQIALDAYRSKWSMTSAEAVSLPDDIVHKLLEPQIISDTFLLWEVISADNSNFALSDSNSIVHVAYRAQFDTFQSALFAKLRYERTHREIKTN